MVDARPPDPLGRTTGHDTRERQLSDLRSPGASSGDAHPEDIDGREPADLERRLFGEPRTDDERAEQEGEPG